MPTRRAVLRATGAALGGGLLVGSASGDHVTEAQPDHVTIEYDQAYLDRYKPKLAMPYSEQQKFLGLYGWVASSPEHDTNVCVYWASYTHQDGWLGDLDSHEGDHEPVQVEVDKQTGEVTRVRASVYHWLKGESTPDAVPMDGSNPRLRVIKPWHQYTAAGPNETAHAFDIEDLTSEFQGWLDNGLELDLLPGSSTNPWKMQYEDDWWRSDRAASAGLFDLPPSVKSSLVRASKAAGFGTVGSLTG